MIDDGVVVDAVVHPYNLAQDNQDPLGREQLESVYASHLICTGDAHREYQLSRDEFFADFPFEAIADSLFVESPVDLAVIHALPNLGFAKGYVTDPARAAAYRDRHPHRFRLYATVDTPVTDRAIAQLERQVRELGVDGLKLYPAFFYGGRGVGWRLDGPDFATPLLSAASDLGIRNVAVHKALWLPPAPRDAFGVDDLTEAPARFPELNFQIVHAGAAFLDQTAALLARHPNVYATLETVFAYAVVRPDTFAKIMATLVGAAGVDQLLYASGTNLSHPGPLLAAFDGYEFSQRVLEEYGVEQLTAADRGKILGGNALRTLRLGAGEVRAWTADDEFAARRASERPVPWGHLRSTVRSGR